MSKFETSYFWKHKRSLDCFIVADFANPHYDGIMIYGNWMIQGVDQYWPATEQYEFLIKESEISNWEEYTPKGKYYGT